MFYGHVFLIIHGSEFALNTYTLYSYMYKRPYALTVNEQSAISARFGNSCFYINRWKVSISLLPKIDLLLFSIDFTDQDFDA